jgi:hypothetical protein
MRKIILTVTALMAVTFLQAQDITDAVRYSSEGLTGTARFRAMSGAFGALGGDLSSLNVNPAGSAIFLNSYSTVTLNYNRRNNTTSYFNSLTANENSNVYFDQAGAVLVFNSSNPENNWSRFNIGINYLQTNNFDDNFTARGTGSSSIDQYFLGYANGVPLELLETVENETVDELYSFLGENQGFGAQQAFLGFQGFIINPNSNELQNTSYTSTVAAGSFNQQYVFASTGLNGKFTFNFASAFKDVFYIGANLNAHFLNYDRATRLTESNTNPGSETNRIIFVNNLSTTGEGFSAQVGAIAKIGEVLRLGASYETPTWFSINEKSTQRLETFSNEFNEEVIVNPEVVNIYPPYKLQTPGKITGSAALVLGKQGLISFDYSYKDYSETEFKPSGDPEFTFQNAQISDRLKAASTYKVGGEYRIGNLSLRGGYRIEESPYKDELTIGELTGYSAGLGYNFGNIKLDLAYDNSTRTDNPQLYQVGLTNTAGIERDFSSVILSLSFGI